MSRQLDRIMDAAYACFVRHGVRKTTMEDISTAAGMSRPAMYQYVKNKDDTYRRLARRLYDDALAQARQASETPGTLTQRLDRVLAVRLELLTRVHRATPHAAELIGDGSKVAADLDRSFLRDLADLLTGTIMVAAAEAELPLRDDNAREVVELALALTRGLELDLTNPYRPTPHGPTADGPTPDGPTTDGPTTDRSTPDGPTKNRPASDGPTPHRMDPDQVRDRLRNGVALLIAGLSAAVRPS